MSEKLMELFNKSPRLSTLSTSSKDGKIDVAVFGSPRMVNEKTVIIALPRTVPSLIFKKIPMRWS